MQAAGTPSPGRIASILRSQDAWPKLESPLDLAHRLASQQRQLVDQSLPVAPGPCHSSAVSVMPVDRLLALRGGGSVDSQVSQLAERVSVLVAGVQKRCDEDKHDLEQQIDKLEARAEARLGSFEARLACCDHRHDSTGSGAGRAAAAESQALVLREARALIGTGLGEAQTLWRSEHSELRAEQREHLRQLEELAESTRHAAARLEQAERVLGAQERSLRRLGEDLEAVMDREACQAQNPPWFGQLEGAISALDRRLNEQQVQTEVQLARLQVDSDGLRRRSEVMAGVREDLMQAVEAKLEQELSRLSEVGHLRGGGFASGGVMSAAGHELKDLARRLDDVEARAAAQRVKVEAHDARFSNLGERIEAVCQQAAEHARQVCQAKAEEMFSEVDCQNRVLRKRIETLSELCEELMLRQVSVEATRATAAGSNCRSVGSKQRRAAGIAYEAHAAGAGARLDAGLENLLSRLPSLAEEEEDCLAGSSLSALEQRLNGFRDY
eukprot:TRINITY_DN31925_c0_g1_i1.p1 TRINITY_DN31925_c0_g1~~TRINITY_DN31925_c0_g1_i1.p1  ORF type:complete len:498 (+),score=128.33 TRINITY_DN31925_c0_g1_i1:44-1537(+)